MDVDMCWKFGHIYFSVRGKSIVNGSDIELVGWLVTWMVSYPVSHLTSCWLL